jgi:hypothetical protein
MESSSCTGHSEKEIWHIVDQVCSAAEEVLSPEDDLYNSKGDEAFKQIGKEIVGCGTRRIVLEICEEHVLKVEPFGSDFTTKEFEVWNSADSKVREALCPILGCSGKSSVGWTLMPRCDLNQEIDWEDPILERIPWIGELGDGNVGYLNGRLVALDYDYIRDEVAADKALSKALQMDGL